ncbi:MXAN_2561 family MXYO-CTERM-anchored protein [Pyxidicoccus trucidator]|uniref:MXAN_2561 family MXYO-CTERM-anchored protein n=1 Tax=Pyxidicoccus trucidator TaxID=2709662 RepID=UPI0013DAEFC5|nr:MXAN_2561 family MXYO-CTERM-anchored protein [Pyxidicoccus trucidator]
MRFLLVGLLLFASTALGQTLTLTVNNTPTTNQPLGLNSLDCDRDLDLDWTFAGVACEPLQLWVTTSGSCREEPATGDYVLEDVPEANVSTPGTVVRSIDVSRLPIFSGTDGGTGTCETASVEQTMRVCGATFVANALNPTACDVSVKVSTAPLLRFDTKAPPKPAISAVSARDSALGVTVTAESDTTVKVSAYPLDADGGVGTEVSSDETTSTEGTAELLGLENGVTYRVVAVATDVAKNASEPSDPSEGTPVASNGFYGGYLGAGGDETGGCGATGGGIAGGAVLAALGFWLSRRKQS